jgi:outer membrane protein assembly factor BamE (lipoprotein component of BamABCDE complex)
VNTLARSRESLRLKLKQAFAVASALTLTLLLFHSNLEAYCFFYPAIDTRFATGFSEKAWSQVSTGMTTQVVQKILGEPLLVRRTGDGEVWSYTMDGKCMWGSLKLADYAWLCRQIYVNEGRVREVVQSIRYD